VCPFVSPIGEDQLTGGDVGGLDVLDVALAQGLRDRVGVDHLAFDRPVIGAKRRRGDADDLRLREVVEDIPPARGRVVVTLVDDDHVEEVVREVLEPTSAAAGELLDVRDDDVDVVQVAPVGGAIEDSDPRVGSQFPRHVDHV
jgi:hypothetical protein